MIWNLLTQPTGTYPVEIDLLNGDWDKNQLEDMSVDIGRKPLTRADFFQSGRRMRTDFLPTIAKRSGAGTQPIEDYKDVRLAQICSGAFRELVEQFDPGVHQFEALEILDRNGQPEKRDFFWFFPGVRLHALDPDRVIPPLSGPGYYDQTIPPADWHFVFQQAIVSSHDVFCTAEVFNLIFVSDRLKQAIEIAGFSGIRFAGPYDLS
ncbi:hypothetical protein SAMN05444358_10166 [Ruegeria halocynthiae]|uniref:Immunity MXAN-0049 protein domain-containing protein n=1 Tax=Ruegeria halocynthiae TaxID=985054 RepID=A0A1H2R7A4_9RHOB|nr:DUF1629 domain-containing protein [Ruegeria halocynthiae]SDW15346.1 hypothetical protein SAMN05444358_10166 [Ruegeria halocynthiae]